MKVNYNGHIPKKTELCYIPISQAFEFEDHYYMKIEIKCANVTFTVSQMGLLPIANLHSGTVRVIPKESLVWPLRSKVSLRQPCHTHEELNGERE